MTDRVLTNNEGMTYYHTRGAVLSRAKIAITIDQRLLEELDRLVAEQDYPNRSRAIEEAVADKLDRLSRNRLAVQCAKLDPASEQALAEEGMSGELSEWPEY